MKKVLVFCSALVVLAATSCNKKEAATTPAKPNLYKTSVLLLPPLQYLPNDGSCKAPQLDCSNTPLDYDRTNLDNAIASGAIAVGAFFSNPTLSGTLYPDLTAAELTKLQSGTYTLLLNPKAVLPTYLIGDASTLSLTTYEYALVCN